MQVILNLQNLRVIYKFYTLLRRQPSLAPLRLFGFLAWLRRFLMRAYALYPRLAPGRCWPFLVLSGAPSLAPFLFLHFRATLSPPSRSPIASQLGLVGTPFPRPRHWLAPFFCSCSSPRLAICPDVAASSGCPAMDLPREARCFVTPQ